MKKIFPLFVLLILINSVFAQDYIKLKTGEGFYGSIKEVTPTEIFYRSVFTSDTIIYSIDKKYVFFVKYNKKKKEIMNPEKIDPKKVVIAYKHKYQITAIDGGDYLIEGRRGEFEKLRSILLDLKDPELTKVVKKFTKEKRMGTVVLYCTIPIGATTLMMFFYNHAVGFGDGNPAIDRAALGLLGVEMALFTSSIYLNKQKKKHINEAIVLYNSLLK